jgi:hypothetical protein
MATLAATVYMPYPRYADNVGNPLVISEGSVVGVGGFTAAMAAYVQAPSAWVGGSVPYSAPAADPAIDPSAFTLPRYSRTEVVNGRPVGYPTLASDPSPTPGASRSAPWLGAENSSRRYDTAAVPTLVRRGK